MDGAWNVKCRNTSLFARQAARSAWSLVWRPANNKHFVQIHFNLWLLGYFCTSHTLNLFSEIVSKFQTPRVEFIRISTSQNLPEGNTNMKTKFQSTCLQREYVFDWSYVVYSHCHEVPENFLITWKHSCNAEYSLIIISTLHQRVFLQISISVVIVRKTIFFCTIWIYWKSLNGSLE